MRGKSRLLMLLALLGLGCASTLEWTVAVGPKARAELYVDAPVVPHARQLVTVTEDHLLGADVTTTTEGPAQPPPKSVAQGSDAPKVSTWLSTAFAWLAGLF